MASDPHRRALGIRIKERRQELGLNQAELAARLGCAPSGVSKAERNGIRRKSQLARFAQALEVEPSYLTTTTTDPRLEAARTRLTSAAELLDEARKLLEATP